MRYVGAEDDNPFTGAYKTDVEELVVASDFSSGEKSYTGTSVTIDLTAVNGNPIYRHIVTPTGNISITLPDLISVDHPGRMTIQVKNASAYTVTLAGSNWALQPNIDLSVTPQPVFDLIWDHEADQWRVGNIAGGASGGGGSVDYSKVIAFSIAL